MKPLHSFFLAVLVASCKNPENEFPDKIRYWRLRQRMYAPVSNGELEIPFEFEPMEE